MQPYWLLERRAKSSRSSLPSKLQGLMDASREVTMSGMCTMPSILIVSDMRAIPAAPRQLVACRGR